MKKNVRQAIVVVAAVGGMVLLAAVVFIGILLLSNGAFAGVPAAVVTVVVVAAAWRVITRRPTIGRRAAVGLAVPAVLVSLVAVCLCVPVASTQRQLQPPSALADKHYWALPTGSRVAYWRLPARPGVPKQPTPVVFVHGGPGGYAGERNRLFLSQLTAEGYDVWLYDQAGAGDSDLLPMADYTHERNVADFAAVLDQIGSQKYLVISQSYGALIVASALADPTIRGRIAKAAFVEPAAYDYSVMSRLDDADMYAGGKPNGGQRAQREEGWRSAMAKPRIILSAVLPAGNRFVGQEESTNAFSGADLRSQRRGSVCLDNYDRIDAASAFPVGLNLKANMAINNRGFAEARSIKTQLAASGVPIMVMLGECSYVGRPLQAALITDYPVVERVQYLTGVGHAVWDGLDDHDAVALRCLTEFFSDQPPTIPNYPTKDQVAEFLRQHK